MKLPAISIIRIARTILDEHIRHGIDPLKWDDCIVEVDEAVRAFAASPKPIPTPRSDHAKRRSSPKGARAELLRFLWNHGGSCLRAQVESHLRVEKAYGDDTVRDTINHASNRGLIQTRRGAGKSPILELTAEGQQLGEWFALHPTKKIKRDAGKQA